MTFSRRALFGLLGGAALSRVLPAAPLHPDIIQTQGIPVLTGIVEVGEPFAIQWYRNGIPILGALGDSYEMQPGDDGAEITASWPIWNSDVDLS